MGSAEPRAKGGSCGASFLPPCRSASGGGGGHPLVRTADARTTHAETEPQQRTHRAGSVRSRRCGTSRTEGEDASPHPGSPRPSQSTRVGTAGSGPPRSPRDRTAHTTGWRTGTPSGCAATAWCRQRHHVTPDPCPLPSGASGSARRLGSTRGTRVPSTGGGVYEALIHLRKLSSSIATFMQKIARCIATFMQKIAQCRELRFSQTKTSERGRHEIRD